MNKSRLLGALCACALSFTSITLNAADIPFEIIDVYSSINIQYEPSDGSASDSYYDEIHGALSSSLSHTFDFGPLSGSQEGSITASPSTGTVNASGSSNTVLTSTATFSTWGKHVVLGRFTVPNTGTVFTDVYLDVTISGTNGEAVFRMIDEADWNPDDFAPDGYTSWLGVSRDRMLEFLYRPGDVVYFAFGIEPGISGGGTLINDFDSVVASFQLISNTPVTVPDPGDMNGDGEVNLGDLLLLQRQLLGY